MVKLKLRKKEILLYSILILIIIFSISAWFKQGIPATDDFRSHLTKFWYVKYSYETYGKFLEWMPFIYSGWPLTHFYHPLSYYFSLPLMLLMKPVASLKASVALSFILSAIAMFYSANLLFKKKEIALVAAAIYLFMPMHFEFAYLSGSISRLWAYVFLPLAIAFFIKLVEENSLKYIILGALSFTVLTLSDLNIAFTLAVIMIFYLVYHLIKTKKLGIKNLSVFALLIILLSSFWLFPTLFESQQSTTMSLVEKVFVSPYNPVPYKSLFVRDFGLKKVGDQTVRYFYYGYVLLALVILSAVITKFEYRIPFLILSAICFLFSTMPKILILLPFSSLIMMNYYFILVSLPLLAMLAGAVSYALSNFNKKYSFLILIAIIALFLIDVAPAQSTYSWSSNPTENYLNPPAIIDAYNFVKNQPGLFRVDSLVGEVPFVYTEKMEIGFGWMGYRQGALKPMRDISDNIFDRINKNISDEKTAEILGYLGDKYYVLPCIQNFTFKTAYSNGAVCVYENPYFKPLIISPDSIIKNKNPDVFSMQLNNSAILLEDCENECTIKNNIAEIKNIKFEPEDISFETSSKNESYVLVKSTYFKPHWKAYIDSKEAEIKEAWPIYMLIKVPAGENTIELKYENNLIHTIGRLVSGLTILALIVLLIYRRKKK